MKSFNSAIIAIDLWEKIKKIIGNNQTSFEIDMKYLSTIKHLNCNEASYF